MKIGIVGLGHVGTAMNMLFRDAVVYDEPKCIGTRERINECYLVFVCVPTPMRENGSCDTSVVEDVVSWLTVKCIVLRSTVPVGFVDSISNKTGKRIVFQPEYYGETVAHPFSDLKSRTWITLGGKTEDVKYVVNAYQRVYNSDVRIRIVSAKTAELAKYMENAFFATKVIFCNEFYDIANEFGVDYNELRETWLEDPRIGRSHTFVYHNDRGFGGSCLPKDVSSIIFQANEHSVNCDLLKTINNKNELYHKDK